MPQNMKNGENRALAEKMDRMEGKMDRIAKKKDKKMRWKSFHRMKKKSMLILFFIGFI
jgi:hypothetical protein